MTSTGLQVVQCIFSNAWRLFNSWHVPGTNVSPAMWFVFLLVIPMGIKLVLAIVGMTGVFSAYSFTEGKTFSRRELFNQLKVHDAVFRPERKYDANFADAMAYRSFRESLR